VNVALIGEVKAGRALRRSGAKAGDVLFVTGTLGDSAAGLYSLQYNSRKTKEIASLLVKRHLTPVPRFNVGELLSAKRWATSAIDVSDGLSSEIHHLCDESKVGAEIHEDALPLSPSFRAYCEIADLDPLHFVLNGGEDYELLFTVPPDHISKVVQKVPAETGTAIKSIGRMVPAAKGITLITRKGKRLPLKAKGFDHFSKG
jgi:thiamine-monophosphate kinase